MKSYMNIRNINSFDPGIISVSVLALSIALMFGNGALVLAQGGEDHGEAKPKSTANAKGEISHSARLGELDVMVKHPVLEPERPTTGSLFITRFETNEPVKNALATVELESAGGAIFTGTVQAELEENRKRYERSVKLGSYRGHQP